MKRPLSMTAFGRGEYLSGSSLWNVEIRSVNHRFCDIKIKMPKNFLALEERLKKVVQEYYSRGHVEILVNPPREISDHVQLQVNLPLAREYYNCLQAINRDLGLNESPSLAMIKDQRDIIVAEEREEDQETYWPSLEAALRAALANCQAMRENEGQSLKTELSERLTVFQNTLNGLEKSIPELLAKKEQKLKERLEKLLNGVDIDPARLAQEAAIISEKCDVTEELVRLRSHIDQFAFFLEMQEPAGRRLDFLLQEFLREINTLASKIGDAAIAHQSVELKNEIEKLREQVQNLE